MNDQVVPESTPRGLPLLLSILFHPLLVPTYMFILLIAINPFLFGASNLGEKRALLLLLMIFLYTFVIPLVSIFIMLKLEMVDSLHLEDRMQRIGPMMLVMILYFWVYYNFSQDNDTPPAFSAALLGVVLALAVSFTVNVVDKISLHGVGMGGLVGMAMITTGLFGGGIEFGGWTIGAGLVTLVITLVAGLVGTARLALGAHTPTQLYSGYLVGFICQWLALKFYF